MDHVATLGGVSHGATLGGMNHVATLGGVSHGATLGGMNHGSRSYIRWCQSWCYIRRYESCSYSQ